MGKKIQKPIKCYKDVSELYLGDCLNVLPTLEADSIDTIVTDPPYGISFMGKDWDNAVPSIAIWRECLRVLKPGAFAFVMCIPRQDCLARMICRLEDAGFNIGVTSIYWTYATGFPKAQNLAKVADKRARKKREVIGYESSIASRPITKNWKVSNELPNGKGPFDSTPGCLREITIPATPQAKALEGAYSGFQPKPAVEVIIVAMKPLSENTYTDQAIANGHGCTWLDECKIPLCVNEEKQSPTSNIGFADHNTYQKGTGRKYTNKGRFPANVLCEDDILNNGIRQKTEGHFPNKTHKRLWDQVQSNYEEDIYIQDKGSFSRYFSLDNWFAERIKILPIEAQKTFPWLIVPKAAKSEKNQGLFELEDTVKGYGGNEYGMNANNFRPDGSERKAVIMKNSHATVKPIKLMSWLITLASREGDIILDPFCGSGTTLIAAKMLRRQYIGIELEKKYYDIARLRIDEAQRNIDSFL